MKQDVTKWMFEDTFRSSQYKNNFSYEGLLVGLNAQQKGMGLNN